MSESKRVRTEVRTSGDLAHMVAALAVQTIGPTGTIVRVPEEDASLIRATFIGKLAEAAIMIANGETPK